MPKPPGAQRIFSERFFLNDVNRFRKKAYGDLNGIGRGLTGCQRGRFAMMPQRHRSALRQLLPGIKPCFRQHFRRTQHFGNMCCLVTTVMQSIRDFPGSGNAGKGTAISEACCFLSSGVTALLFSKDRRICAWVHANFTGGVGKIW